MKETIFNEIYNQYEPDKEIVSRLMTRVGKEKPKAVSFRPMIAVASAAAGLALCFAAWKLLPSGPNIAVENPATGTSQTTTSALIATDMMKTEKTTTTTPETILSTNHTWGDDTTDVTCAHGESPEITCACTQSYTTTVTLNTEESKTEPVETTTVTATSLPETSAVNEETTTTTATTTVTTMPAIAETSTEESTEEEPTTEVAYEDTSDKKEMPMFDTFGEYCDYFKLRDKLHNVRFTCRLVSEGYTTKIDTEIDGAVFEDVLSTSSSCMRNMNAPYHYKNVQFYVYDEFSVHIQKSGSIQLYVTGYNDLVVFEGDPEMYKKLLRFAKSLEGGEVIAHATTSEYEYSEDEIPPEINIEPDEE